MNTSILIIDDDNLVCLSLKKVLSRLGYQVEVCMEGGKVYEAVEINKPDIILLDIYLTTHNGLDILKVLHDKYFEIPVIMITGYSDVQIAVSAMKIGAFDFLLKPIDLDQLRLTLEKCEKHLNLKKKVETLSAIVGDNESIGREFFGSSKTIKRILSTAEKFAKAADTTILIEGESGTGKEVFANYIHQNSPRAGKVFISLNCGTITKELAESELFGHEKGAFTGAAQKTKLGKFELAEGGTLLLDEIGELSLDLQVKLLRVLQERKFYRLGGEKEISVDVRVMAATNKNLEEEVKKGNFREDLFYRLNVAKITIPPLRERNEDIAGLVYTFAKSYAQKFDKKIQIIDEELITFLEGLAWKGNVRELKNAVERAVLLLESEKLSVQHFNFLKEENVSSANEGEFVLQIPPNGVKIDAVLRELILKTLKLTKVIQYKLVKFLDLLAPNPRNRWNKPGMRVVETSYIYFGER